MNTLALHLIALYQKLFSPLAGFLGAQCRFYPSCSEYARQAFERMPFLRALGLTMWRLARCGPWTLGGVDTLKSKLQDPNFKINPKSQLSAKGGSASGGQNHNLRVEIFGIWKLGFILDFEV